MRTAAVINEPRDLFKDCWFVNNSGGEDFRLARKIGFVTKANRYQLSSNSIRKALVTSGDISM